MVAEVGLQAERHQWQHVLFAVIRAAAPVHDVLAQLKVIVLSSDVIATV